MSAISWNLRVNVNDGQLENFRSLMHEMVAATKEESGTLGYEWFVAEDGSTVHLNERYADSGAAMEHLGNFMANFAERFMGCVTPTSIDVYGEASDQVREAMTAFGAVHHVTFGGFSR
jgi:quinol monooxygenase YgiN